MVPGGIPEGVGEIVTYQEVCSAGELQNVKVYLAPHGKFWVPDFNHSHHIDGRKTKKIAKPDSTRERGYIV